MTIKNPKWDPKPFSVNGVLTMLIQSKRTESIQNHKLKVSSNLSLNTADVNSFLPRTYINHDTFKKKNQFLHSLKSQQVWPMEYDRNKACQFQA